MNKLPRAKRIAIVSALVEGSSVRATARMVGVTKGAVLKLLADVGTVCAAYQDRTLRNLGALLEAASLGFGDVVKTTCFLRDMGDFNAFNEVYAGFFPEPYPARTTVQAARLPMNIAVEIEAIAVRR